MVTKDTRSGNKYISKEGSKKFLLLPLGRYQFSMVCDNRYLPRCWKENVLFTTIDRDVSVARYVIPMVNLPLFLILSWFIEFSQIHLESVKGLTECNIQWVGKNTVEISTFHVFLFKIYSFGISFLLFDINFIKIT